MADVRALLKAKTKERQQEIQHPLAIYNASGQLRCSLCGTLIKFASAWKTHLESKAHKVNEAKELERERLKKGKRKQDLEEDVVMEEDPSKKRKVDTPPVEAPPLSNGFPADFFSDPSRKLPERTGSDDEYDADDDRDQNRPPVEAKSAVDEEWEAFERALMSTTKPKNAVADIFNQATISAEPELVEQVPDGFPPSVTSNEQSTKSGVPVFKTPQRPGQGTTDDQEEEEKEETEFDKQKRKELEEKELIMDRLADEERAQEEADDKVRALKARVEALKLQRQARLAKKKAN